MQENKILFVDDDKEILTNYKKMFDLKEESKSSAQLSDLFAMDETSQAKKSPFDIEYSTHIADQGEAAVKMVEEAFLSGNRFKVAFIDMRMPPGIDGKETAKRMREIDPDLEIVIVTAYSDHDLESIVMDVGAPDKLLYLKKPFDPAEIQQCALSLTSKWDEARIKDEFLANISHELKTPLSSIIGFSDILLEAKNLPKDLYNYAEIIKNSGNLMSFLINDLITMVKLGNKNITLDKSSQDLNELLLETLDFFRPVLNKRPELKLLTQLAPMPIRADVDRDRFTQCFINLLSNAIKYTEEGEITLITKVENNNIHISFKDTGMGIEQSKLSSIFEKFERLEKDHHAIPGLGLGLSICKKIADLHQADLTVESEKGKGSTFTLKIKEAS